MWTDHPHVPALERDWLLYVEKPLAVPFLSIIILLLVTKNRTLNTSPRDVKWHRSLSIVNQCVLLPPTVPVIKWSPQLPQLQFSAMFMEGYNQEPYGP